MQQNVDPRQAGIDWAQFREAQREPARAAVASALVLDEIARREGITVAAEDVDKEIEQFAARAGRTPAALRAQLEKEGGIARLSAGLRREKAVDLALSRATITDECPPNLLTNNDLASRDSGNPPFAYPPERHSERQSHDSPIANDSLIAYHRS